MNKKILMIDNYDSFTYNIVAITRKYAEVTVVRNDEINLNELDQFDQFIISPGPGLPSDAGQLMDAIRFYHDKKSMLGICLGHQAIASFFNAELRKLENPVHGKQSEVSVIKKSDITRSVPNQILVGRYHSWVVHEKISESLESIMETDSGEIMGLQHKKYPIYGLQFHPESILTPLGETFIKNFINKVS